MRDAITRLLATLLAAVLLLPVLQQQPSLVAGQGLEVPAGVLNAGVQATADALTDFEDLVSLSDTNTGGRGRGGRGRGGNLGGGSFRSKDEMAQLQTSMYYVGTSPKKYSSFDPPDWYKKTPAIPAEWVKDQGLLCNSCVGAAVATAVQLSVANTLKVVIDPTNTTQNFDADLRAAYYCTRGGKTCKTGWDIPQALKEIVDDNPSQLNVLRPDTCLKKAFLPNTIEEREAEVSDWRRICKNVINPPSNETFRTDKCERITQRQPGYECTYTAFSSFWQIQQHIRNHGAVISRIAINDDWEVQFNETAKNRTHLEWPPYTRNATAKLSFGHAVVIVGYNNEDYTWTIMNSWGRGREFDISSNSRNRRFKGVTADGVFRIRMGVAGVGSPEQTFGVKCYPANGTALNPNGEQLWFNHPNYTTVQESKYFAKGGLDERGCTKVEVFDGNWSPDQKMKSIGQFVDWAELDQDQGIRAFMQSSRVLGWFGMAPYKYKFPYKMQAEEMRSIISSVTDATRALRVVAAEPGSPFSIADKNNTNPGNNTYQYPFFQCWRYNATGHLVGSPFYCSESINSNYTYCAQNGSVACTLHYVDVGVSGFRDGADLGNGVVEVCNTKWTENPKAFYDRFTLNNNNNTGGLLTQQQDALRAILRVLAKNQNLTNTQLEKFVYTGRENDVINTNITKLRPDAIISWYVKWQNDSVTELFFRVRDKDNVVDKLEELHPNLNSSLWTPLLLFPKLEYLDMLVYGGQLPLQFGSISTLKKLYIYYYCMSGALPNNYIERLENLEEIVITRFPDALGYVPPDNTQCGISGSIPAEWAASSNRSKLNIVDLSNNELSGVLPGSLIVNWWNLTDLSLANNSLSSRIPPNWWRWSLNAIRNSIYTIDLRGNLFSGPFPVQWWRLDEKIGFLHLDGNAKLTGCFNVSAFTLVTFSGTSMSSGLCKTDINDIHTRQNATLQKYLDDLLAAQAPQTPYSSPAPNCQALGVVNEVKSALNRLGSLVKAGQVRTSIFRENPENSVYVELVIQQYDATEYVTAIRARAACLNTSVLPVIAAGLPKFEEFRCDYCTALANNSLPPALAMSAPNLRVIEMEYAGITGRLPWEWSSLSKLEEVLLSNNTITGPLPTSWKVLKSLLYISLTNNQLSGTLPAAWAEAKLMPKNMQMFLGGNNLTGTVPVSYSYFSSAFINVEGTNVAGCYPDGPYIWPLIWTYKSCSSKNNTDAQALYFMGNTLTRLADGNSDEFDVWKNATMSVTTWNEMLRGAGPNTPPRFCRELPGVTCNDIFEVTGLDLTSLGVNINQTVDNSFTKLANSIWYLMNLESLNISDMGFRGTVPRSLADWNANLKVIDISNNGGIFGTLPESFAAATALEVFHISHTNISGTLPAKWASMGSLKEFRAEVTDLSGALPESWALMQNLQVLEIPNASLSGPIPAAWAEETSARALAVSAYATARVEAKQAKSAVETAAMALNQLQLKSPMQQRTGRARRQAEPSPPSVASIRSRVDAFVQLKAQAQAAARVAAALAQPNAFLGMTNLQELVLEGNALTGTIPAAFSNVAKLRVLALGNQRVRFGAGLTGPLPREWGVLNNLEVLSLFHNNLNGSIPMEYGRLLKLRKLNLGGNSLTGTLPTTLVALRELVYLDVSNNGLSGTIKNNDWNYMGNPAAYKLQCMVLYGNPELFVQNRTELEDFYEAGPQGGGGAFGKDPVLQVITDQADRRCEDFTLPEP